MSFTDILGIVGLVVLVLALIGTVFGWINWRSK
jgi:hypothetical protein